MPNEFETIPIEAGLTFLLVLSRIAGLFLFVPLPGIRSGPEAARVVLAVTLTIALYPCWPTLPPGAMGIGRLAGGLLSEAGLGIAIGLVVAFLIEAFSFGAQLLSLQAGFSYASTIDPNTQAESGVLAVMAQLFVGLLFFTTGLYTVVIRVLAQSLETIPPGGFKLSYSLAESVMRMGGEMVSAGFRLALPLMALLALLDLTLGLCARLNAQLQLLALAFPAKMLLTLVTLGWFVSLWPKVFEQTGGNLLRNLQTLLFSGSLP